MKNIPYLFTTIFCLSVGIIDAQTVEVFQTFGSNAEIHMTPKSTGGNNVINMLKPTEFDKSLWRLIYEKNDLLPPDGPIEFAWEVGLGAGFSVDPDFFSIGRYDFNIDFIFSRAGLVMDNETLFTGINELTPNARLHVYNNDDFGSTEIPAALFGEFPGAGADYGYLTVDQPDTDDNSNIARFRDDGITQVWINRGSNQYQLTVFGDALASGGVWQNSDLRLKKNIQEIHFGLEGIRRLRPSTYTYNRDPEWNKHLPEEQQFGIVAQELKKVYPNLVRESDQLSEEGEVLGTIQSVNYTGLIPILIASVQELDQNLTTKSEEVSQLKSENAALAERLERLEKLVDGLTKD